MTEPSDSGGRMAFGMVLCCFLMIAAFFLLSEHAAHLFGALPWLLLSACMLMLFFMDRRPDKGGQ